MKKLCTSLFAMILTLTSIGSLSVFAAEMPEEKLPVETIINDAESGSAPETVSIEPSNPVLLQTDEGQDSELNIEQDQISIEENTDIDIDQALEQEVLLQEEDLPDQEKSENSKENPDETSSDQQVLEMQSSQDNTLYGWNGETYISYLSGQPVKGFLNYNGDTYYFDENGMVVRNQTREINGRTYRFDETGKVFHGFVPNGDRNYYYSQYDGHQQSGKKYYDGQEIRLNIAPGEQGKLIDNNGVTNYVYSDGSLATNELVNINGQNYYFNELGNKVVGESLNLPGGVVYLNFKDGAQTDEKTFRVQSEAKQVVNLVGTSLYDLFIWSSGLSYNSNVSHYLDPIDYGLMAFENHSGNCYVYAAAFYYLADLLGYTIQYIKGQVLYNTGNVGDHAWTAIRDGNGKLYFYDPEAQYELGRTTSFWKVDPYAAPIRYLYDNSIL